MTYNCSGYEEIWRTEPVASEVSSASVPKLCELYRFYLLITASALFASRSKGSGMSG